ncbi:MAG: hypothetical protein MUF54_17710 [Polyangiaceae bacterium]|nr:hypothetical protein [Polyangiaceae bacterium]
MKHVSVCSAIGSKSEGWYYQHSGKLMGWDQCEGVGVTCYAVGTSSDSFVRADNATRTIGPGQPTGCVQRSGAGLDASCCARARRT